MKRTLFISALIALLSMPIVAHNGLDIRQNTDGSITISFEQVEDAVAYRIYHGATRLTATNLLATLQNPTTYTFTHTTILMRRLFGLCIRKNLPILKEEVELLL